MNARRSRLLVRTALLVIAALSVVTTLTLSDTTDADAAELGVRTNLPQVGVGEVLDSAQVGDWIVVVGDFTQVRERVRPDAATLQQSYAYAYNINTGDLVWQPSIDGIVRSVEAISSTSFAIGGDFSSIDGIARRRVAVIEAGQVGRVRIDVDSRVRSLAYAGNHLYGAGSFATVNGSPSRYIFRVDVRNGAVDSSFDKSWGGFVGKPGTSGAVIIDVTPDGSSAFVLHRYATVDGVSAPGIAKITTQNGVVDGTWRARSAQGVDVYRGGMCGGRGAWMRDLEISPDGTFLAVANHAGDWNDIGCDTILRFETGGTGHVTWASRVFDAVLSVGVENDTVYAGGHFWFAPSQYSERGAFPGNGAINNPKFTPSAEFNRLRNSGQVFSVSQLTALDANTGQGIADWTPNSNAFKGVTSIEVIPRGLLIGQHQFDLIGVIGDYQTGNHAFFDGNSLDRNRDMAFQQPTRQSSTGFGGVAERAVDGAAFGNWNGGALLTHTALESNPWWEVDLGETVELDRVLIFNRTDCCGDRLANASIFVSDQPIPAGLTMAQTRALQGVTEVALPGGTPPAISTIAMNGATGRYLRIQIPQGYLTLAEVRAFGVSTAPPPPPPPPPPPEDQTCTATEANGVVTLDWTAIAGENNYIVRRNNAYVATAGNTLTFDESPGNGTFTYLIRSNMAGVQTNTTCNPTITIDDGPPPAGQTCTATTNGNGSITLDWTSIAGENNYIVRRNGAWLTTAGNTLTYTDNAADPGDTYIIRSNMAGVQTNTTCD